MGVYNFGSLNIDHIYRLDHIAAPGETLAADTRSFAAGGEKGMIYTYMWAFDLKEDWDYVEHVKDIFRPYGTEFYYVELVAPQDVRLKRNLTENRLANKPSKRDTVFSEQNLLEADRTYRLESYDGEIPFENYIKIDNSNLSPRETAEIIRKRFGL